MPGRDYTGTPYMGTSAPLPPDTTNTDTTTTTTNMVVVGILIGLICVLSIILVILLIRPVMHFLRTHMPENHRRKELRYQTVEGWVISKRIRKHDEYCAYAMEHFVPSASHKNKSDPVQIGHTTSYDTAETVPEESMEIEWKECPICMEEFKANEIVSWSPDDQTSCPHFFHHECLKEWLLRSPHCPYCRCTIIPVDDEACGHKVDKETLITMSKRRARKGGTTFCCLDHGLVKVCQPTAPLSRRGQSAWEAVLLPRVEETELVARRGGRHELNDDCTENYVGESSCNSSSIMDLELSSIIISRGTPQAPTVLADADALPPSRHLVDVETGVVPREGSDSPPPSFSYVQLSDEQATGTTGSEGA